MPYKHQSDSYRDGGKWTCWCEGRGIENAKDMTADIRRQGFEAKREGDQVFVRPADTDKIES